MVVSKYSKEIWIGWLSSLIEAYNMAIYSFIAPLFAPLLFQNSSKWSALFFSYLLVFAGSCLLYPAGAIYYGLKGDRTGRRSICMSSTLGLAIATGLMSLLPFNWIYFLVLIGGQYFFSGGEYHGSIIYSLEHATHKPNGLMSSLSCLFAVFGLVMASGVATLAFLFQNPWAMRAAFLLGATGGILSYFLKTRCLETPPFRNSSPSSSVTWTSFIRQEWRKIVTGFCVIALFITVYNYLFIFLPLANLNAQEFSTFKSLILYGIFLVLSGLLADRIGVQKTMFLGMILFDLLLIPLTLFCKNLLLLQMVLTPCICLIIGPIHGWLLNQFSVKERCRGIFLSSALATALFGGSTVPICMLLLKHFDSLAICSLYPLFIALITGIMYSSSQFPRFSLVQLPANVTEEYADQSESVQNRYPLHKDENRLK